MNIHYQKNQFFIRPSIYSYMSFTNNCLGKIYSICNIFQGCNFCC